MPNYQPPAQPTQVNQEQNQNQNQDGTFNNGYSPTSSDNNTTNSTSNSENAIKQTGSISNFNVQNNNNSYFQFAGGTRAPVKNQIVTNVQTDYEGNNVSTVTWVHNFGGGLDKMAKREIETYNLGAVASLCMNLAKEGIAVDYNLNPEFTKCQGFSKVAIVPEVLPVASNEIDLLKAQMKDQLALMKTQQQTIEALQLRLIQMQHEPTSKVTGG